MAAKTVAPDLSRFRNIGVIAHIDAGKTTTTEHLLYYAGATHKLGSVDAGTTETDYNAEEQERGITIYSACIPFQWQDCTINLIDTPGHVDFTAEVERSLRVLDGAVVVFDAQKGVEAQSETVWRQADKYHVPRLVFINKMDVVGANFLSSLEDIRERLEGRPVALTIPIGSGSPKDSPTPFRGIVDLLTMQALFFDDPYGKKIRSESIPAELQDEARSYREKLFDVLTEHDDQDRVTSAYLDGKEIALENIHALLREQTLKQVIQPVLCGSGREHIGIQPLLDAICWYLPSPLDRPPVVGTNPKKKDKEEKRRPDPKEPFCGLVFKIVADSHGGLCYVRVYSGILKANSRPYNVGRDKKEFASKLYHTMADPSDRREVPEAFAGDIVGVIGLKEAITGDTVCDIQAPLLLEPIQFAQGVVSRKIEPESSADKQKLEDTLNLLKREDPTFDWKVDKETGQTLMSGMGVLHLEVKQHRLERDFSLKAARRSTLCQLPRNLAPVDSRCRRMCQARRHHGAVRQGDGRIRTLQGASADHDRISGGSGHPAAAVFGHGGTGHPWGPAVRRTGLPGDGCAGDPRRRRNGSGIVQRHGLPGRRRRCRPQGDARQHHFAGAGDAPGGDGPGRIPGTSDADLNARRAVISDVLTRGKLRVIPALVSLERMFDYSDKVRSMSQGRASWTMEPHAYAPAPEEVLRRLLHPEDFL